MKKLLLSVIVLLSVNVLFAQFEKKIESSNKDIQNEKKKTNPKTWTDRAALFQQIYEEPTKGIWSMMDQAQVNLLLHNQTPTGNEVATIGGINYNVVVYPDKKLYFNQDNLLVSWDVTKKIVDDPLQTAYEAYQEAIKVDKNQGVGNKKITEGMTTLASLYSSEAIKEYQLERYETALADFKKSLELSSNPLVGKTDSLIIYYTGITAGLLKDYDTSIEYFNKAIDIDYTNDGETYIRLATIYGESGNKAKQLETLEKAMAKFPENIQITLSLIDYYRFTGEDPRKVLPLMDKAKAADPNNAALYYAEGSVYEKIAEESKAEADYEKAAAGYRKATEIDPNYFFGYYGLGALYFNRGANYTNEASTIPINETEKYENLMKLADEQFEKAMPVMLKAYELRPEEKSIIQSLKDIYFRFRNKSDEYKAQYEKFNGLLQE